MHILFAGVAEEGANRTLEAAFEPKAVSTLQEFHGYPASRIIERDYWETSFYT